MPRNLPPDATYSCRDTASTTDSVPDFASSTDCTGEDFAFGSLRAGAPSWSPPSEGAGESSNSFATPMAADAVCHGKGGKRAPGGVSWWAEIPEDSVGFWADPLSEGPGLVSEYALQLPSKALDQPSEVNDWDDLLSPVHACEEDGPSIDNIIRNTFIHVGESLNMQSGRRRSRSIPKDMGSSKNAWETTCHVLLSPSSKRRERTMTFAPTETVMDIGSDSHLEDVPFQSLSDIDAGSTVQVLSDVVAVLKACRNAGIGKANDQRRITALGKRGPVLKKDPRDNTVKVSLPEPLGVLWFPVRALMPVPLGPFECLSNVQIGANIQVVNDIDAVLRACRAAGMANTHDKKRISAAGKEGIVLEKDTRDDTVKCHIPEIGDVWFAFAALMPVQEGGRKRLRAGNIGSK